VPSRMFLNLVFPHSFREYPDARKPGPWRNAAAGAGLPS
jgi:hypothetical protein